MYLYVVSPKNANDLSKLVETFNFVNWVQFTGNILKLIKTLSIACKVLKFIVNFIIEFIIEGFAIL